MREHDTPVRQPWIQVIPPEEAEGLLREIYETTRKKRGKIAEIHKIHSLHPESLTAHMDLYLTLLYGRSPLSRREREWIGVVVSLVNRCAYCVAHHTDALRRYEKRETVIQQLHQMAWDNLEEPLATLSRFVEHLTREPWSLTPGDLDRLRAVGYDDRALLDIVQIAAYFNFVNRIVLGLGVPLESEEARQGYRY